MSAALVYKECELEKRRFNSSCIWRFKPNRRPSIRNTPGWMALCEAPLPESRLSNDDSPNASQALC